MTTVSCRAAWQADYAMNHKSYSEILTWDPFRDWERSRAPESTVGNYFWLGLEVLCGEGDPEQARSLLEYCLRIADRTLAERKLESLLCKDSFPENRGELLRVRAYAQGLLGGPLDEGALRQAAADFEGHTLRFPKHKWSDLQEAEYLATVRLALLGNDGEILARLFKRRRVMRWHAEEYALLRSLADGPQRDSPLLANFDAYFDRIRDPKYKPEVYLRLKVLRPELAALRDKYFVSSDGPVDFQRVVGAISR